MVPVTKVLTGSLSRKHLPNWLFHFSCLAKCESTVSVVFDLLSFWSKINITDATASFSGWFITANGKVVYKLLVKIVEADCNQLYATPETLKLGNTEVIIDARRPPTGCAFDGNKSANSTEEGLVPLQTAWDLLTVASDRGSNPEK